MHILIACCFVFVSAAGQVAEHTRQNDCKFYDCYDNVVDMARDGCFEFYELFNLRQTCSPIEQKELDLVIDSFYESRQNALRIAQQEAYNDWCCTLCYQSADVCICDSD
jgi:hypothetical protein